MTGEGRTDEYPIFINIAVANAFEFECLLDYIYEG